MKRSSALSRASNWEFPFDRSLIDIPSQREDVTITFSAEENISLHQVAFSVLFIFSRMVGQEVLSVCLLQGTQEVKHVVAEVRPQATLAEALASCRILPFAEAPEIGLVISDQGAQGGAGGPVLSICEAAGELRLSFSFDVSRISAVSAQDLLQKIAILLRALATTPQMLCTDIVLVTPSARGFMADLSQEIYAPRPEFVPETFFRIALQHAAEMALSDGAHSYDYGQLARLVRYLAARLTEAGLESGDIVGLYGFSSLGMIASMLAVMAAGGVFVLVDSTLPEERRQLIDKVSQPRLRVEIRPAGEPPSEGALLVTDWPTWEEIKALPDLPVQMAALAPDAPAYVFFTSGSTGVPKGVLGTHAGLGHFLAWQRSNFPIGPGDRVAQLTALSFDPVLREIFLPLTSGSCLKIPQRCLLLDARGMLRWFSDSAITLVHCVPSLMKAWLQADTGGKPFKSLRYILFAGEPLTDRLLTRFARAAGAHTTIVNLYGPTETTLAKLVNWIETIEPGVQPIGYAQPFVDVCVFRDRSARCGLWEIGEIAIRTPYRSQGYLRNPALTAEVFRPNPERNDPEDLIYYTGDLGRVRPDGKVEIFGRTDSQIKIRGVRIEPNEIEGCMVDLPGIRDAAVTVLVSANEEKVLVGLVVPREPVRSAEEGAFRQSVRETLKTRLTEAMVPAQIVLCQSLPYLPNGKIDRKSLAELARTSLSEAEASDHSEELSEVEQKIVSAWKDCFISSRMGRNDSFSSLGGDSLSYVTAYLSLENILGFVPQGWTALRIRELAALKIRKKSKWLCNVESGIMLRAVFIMIVVIFHYGYFTYRGGSTSGLLFISGFIFGGLQMNEVGATRSFTPVLRLIGTVLLPYYAFVAILLTWHLVSGQAIEWSYVFLWEDMTDLSADWNGSHLWYIPCLFHMMCIIMLVLWLGRNVAREHWVAGALICCIGIGAFGRFIAPLFFTPDFLTTPLTDESVYKVSPMSHLGTFALGALAGYQKGQWKKAIFWAIALYSVIAVVPFGIYDTMFIIAAAYFVLFFQTITVPKVLASVIYKIAGASLFIYLLHLPIYRVLGVRLGLPTGLCFVGAILVGYLAWRGWNWSAQNVGRPLLAWLEGQSLALHPRRPDAGRAGIRGLPGSP
jgi:amino acid adenylation domain-containing protein